MPKFGNKATAAAKRIAQRAGDAAYKAKMEAGPKALTDEEKKAAISAAGTRAKETADNTIKQAKGITKEKFGLGEADLAQRAAERQAMFQAQQGSLVERQGAQSRQVQEAMARRLGAQGLAGTGTAERLAEVTSRRLAGASAQEQRQLGMGQQAQELQAREAERQAIQQVTQFGEQARLGAQELATRLEAAGKTAEESRLFATDQLERQQFFQENVVMRMQNDQFKQQLEQNMNQFNEQMKRADREFDLNEEISRFNMAMEAAAQGKGGMFDRIGDMGTSAWKGVGGLGGIMGIGGAIVGGSTGMLIGGPGGAAIGAGAGYTVGKTAGDRISDIGGLR